MFLRRAAISFIALATTAIATGCGSAEGFDDSVDSVSQALPPGHCFQSQPKDVLVAGLVMDSWRVGYPLTRLSVDAGGNVTGPALPDILAGDLDVINSVPDARASVVAALNKVSGLPEYGMAGVGAEVEACSGVPAWTPSGNIVIDTTSIEVFPNGVNESSWRTTHKEFGKVCPLVKRIGNQDLVDPPGDGSTNAPPSSTVSASGVTANAFGLCPSSTWSGTFCKLSYATGVNYTGRQCQYYYGQNRCLLY